MLYSTAVPIEAVDEDELHELVIKLAKVSGQEIVIQKQIAIWTDSDELHAMLESLADAMRNRGPMAHAVERKNGHAKTRKKLGGGVKRRNSVRMKKAEGGMKTQPTRGPHVRSIKIIGSGEMISRFELDKRLYEFAIEPGTELHSPKHGKMIVKVSEDGMRNLVVMNESGEMISKGGEAAKI